MKLESENGESIKITISGYEFPDGGDNEYDKNWLVIQGEIVHPNVRWTFSDPCLLTNEVIEIIDWLEGVSNLSTNKKELSFIEPNLRFELVRNDERFKIRIYFDLESKPHWNIPEINEIRNKEFWLEFNVSNEDLVQAADDLRGQLKSFPPRK